jgi:hypothetical protein
MNNQSSSSISSSLNQLKIDSLPKLKLSNTAKTTILSNQIVEFLVSEIKKIPSYETMSQDLHLFLYIANCIENLEKNELNPKLDKKDIFLQIIKLLFPDLNTQQLQLIDSFVDFICSNGLVKKISNFSYAYSYIKKNLSSN